MSGAQDSVKCGLCNEEAAERICETCNVDLCKNCIGRHVTNNDGSTAHSIVRNKDRENSNIIGRSSMCGSQANKCNILQHV